MGENSSSVKVKEMLARHSELEQSETKAQAALVTILTLTQITELKLLLDIGRQGHRFYDFVLTLLIACISLEIFVGVVIIYVGNLHYYRAATKPETDGWQSDERARSPCRWLRCLATCCCRLCRRVSQRSPGPYQSVHEMTASSIAADTPAGGVPPTIGGGGGGLTSASGIVVGLRRPITGVFMDPDDSALGGGSIERWSAGATAVNVLGESYIDLERADAAIELARVKLADADCRIVRAAGYVKVVDEALRKANGGRNVDLEAELSRARDDLAEAERHKTESEAEQRLAEAHRRRAVYVKDQRDDRQERATFRKVAFWQHGATYLLYFVMLMNVFITTFGISTGPTPFVATGIGASTTVAASTPVGGPLLAKNIVGYGHQGQLQQRAVAAIATTVVSDVLVATSTSAVRTNVSDAFAAVF